MDNISVLMNLIKLGIQRKANEKTKTTQKTISINNVKVHFVSDNNNKKKKKSAPCCIPHTAG